MYVTTRETVRQLPMLSGFLVGTLGVNELPNGIQEFLNELRKHPKDLKTLLLTVMFHPSPQNTWLTFGPMKRNIIDLLLMNNLDPPGPFFDEVRRISADLQKKDAGFRQQIDAELRLRKAIFKAARKVGIDRDKMKPFLLAPLFTTDTEDFLLPPSGLEFAKKMLPPRLVHRIVSSVVSEAHLVRLGRFLRRYGEVLQTKDAAFKQLVEQERRKRDQIKQQQEEKAKQAEEERKQKERRRRRR
jgi:hypothetical protein